MARPFDFSLWSNRIPFALAALVAAAAGYRWADGAPDGMMWAPVHALVLWSLAREVDPDRYLTAHLAAAGAGVWVLSGRPGPELLAAAALILATRLVLNSTGRRPVSTDLVVLGILAAAVSFTRVGWVAAVALAVAIYADARLAGSPDLAPVLTASAAVVGATLVATATRAFSVPVVRVEPWVVAAAGVAAILALLRTPPEPWSVVDARAAWRMEQGRLHGARALLAVAAFLMALLHGQDAVRDVPLVGLLLLAVISSEVERSRRRR